MEKTIYKVDDPKLLKKGLDALLKAFVPMGLVRRWNDVSWYIKGAPGAVTDVTDKLREWVQRNAERFRVAHPEGGVFYFNPVPVDIRYNNEYNSEDTSSVLVDAFSLSSGGKFLFDTLETNDLYDVDICRNHGLSLEEVMSVVELSQGLGTDLYSAFKKIFERADSAFKCEGIFAHLSPGRFNVGWPDSAMLEMKNTLPLDVLLPWRMSFEFDGYSPLLTLSSPNGKVLGWDNVVDVDARMDGVRVRDWAGVLGLDGNDGGHIRASVLLDRLYGLVFSPENLEKVSPVYTSNGLAVPSSGRKMTWEEEARRKKSAEAYGKFNAVKPDANGKGLKK